ncbi:MAG: lipase maturation factor family protein [Myxococcales bacterium]
MKIQPVHWLEAPGSELSRLALQRGLGVVYLIAFLVAVNQFRPLCGERGLLPAPDFLRRVRFWEAPSLFHFHYSDRALLAVARGGVLLAALVILGVPDRGPLWLAMAVWLTLWALYLSLVDIGQTFYAFGWETLLLEAGFLAVFLGPAAVAPPRPVIWMYRWLLFRVEFGAGLIKMRGDPCWRKLTCLDYHHETQPMPNPLSWFFHHLPKPLHRVEVLVNHFSQLAVPFGLFCPQPVASVAAGIVVVTQSWLVLSGNFAWLNLLTLTLAFAGLDGAALRHLLPLRLPPPGPLPLWDSIALLGLTGLVAALSWRPARNLLSREQVMNTSFDPLRLVNSYGAFGSITRVRHEIVIEGTDAPSPSASAAWQAYEFKGKPGDPRKRPRQIAPYHLRLDWLMWFAAMTSPWQHRWFVPLVVKLLENDRATLALIRHNPFPEKPPTFVRALLYRYRFTSAVERRRTSAWWSRELVSEYLPPVGLAAGAEPRR